MNKITQIKATTLTPFNYGHLAIESGVSTIPSVISDRAIAFALCAALGKMAATIRLPAKDYRGHISAMPWRCSVLEADAPRLLPPLARRSDLCVEGGRPQFIQRATASGNFKEYFLIQEVPHGQVFRGAVFGEDPFETADADSFVVRIGSNRTGMLLIERSAVETVRLNAATANLFGQQLPAESYLLHELQLTPRLTPSEAYQLVDKWR